MPKNKSSGRNAFYYYMLDFQKKQGNSFKSMKDVADAAGPSWSKMSKQEKLPYEEKAKKERGGVRYTWDGQRVEDLERREKEAQNRIAKMKDEIDCIIKFAKETGRLRDEMFFIIHINTFCYHASSGRYYPAEIAISCFSLEDGILSTNVYHKIIKPGKLPVGYAHDARKQAEDTHQIPIPLTDEYDDNTEEVYMDIKQFLSSKIGHAKNYPILYAKKHIVDMIQKVLDTWCVDFEDSPPLFKVYHLEYMFQVLKNSVANDIVWPSLTMSETEVDKDVYSHSNGICCEFHSVSEGCMYCSRSWVIRLAYIICDNCCKDLNIPLDPGRHVPDQAFMTLNSRASSKASLFSASSKSSKKHSVREDDSDTVLSFSSASQWENESVTSDSSTATYGSGFPGLKSKRSYTNSQPVDSDSLSQMSGTTYASATVYNAQRGFVRNSANTDSASEYFTSDSFPALGRGRGRGRRH